jgi:hypothetical protein
MRDRRGVQGSGGGASRRSATRLRGFAGRGKGMTLAMAGAVARADALADRPSRIEGASAS